VSTPTEIIVPASERWYHTGFHLEVGARYRITVPPGQVWTDWFVKNGPEGSTTFLQKILRHRLRFPPTRHPRAEFFTLIGTIGESLDNAFVIGAGPCEFPAAISGEFVCFANDLWSAYWNNKGEMRLSIARTT
jgi:hypothetical protein